MHLRKEYASERLDQLFCYFMKTILRIQVYGTAVITVDVSLGQPVDTYLHTAMTLIEEALPPELSRLLLQIEYDRLLSGGDISKEDITLLLLIRELSQHIHYDDDPTIYLLSTVNLWNDTANTYATRTFYCNLLPEIQQREGFDSMLKSLPSSFLEPDNF